MRIPLNICASVLLLTSTALAGPRIEQIAPPTSAVIISARSFDALSTSFKATPLWELWQSPAFKEVRDKTTKDYDEAVKEMYKELGLEGDSLPMPAGHVGLAVFPQFNDELGVNEPGFILTSDFGDRVDRMNEIFRAALTKGEKDKEIEFEEKDIRGRTVVSITIHEHHADAEKEGGDEEFGGMEEMPLPLGPLGDPQKAFERIKSMHYARDGSTLMLSSSIELLTDALEAADGREAKSISASAEYQRLGSRLGACDASAVMIFENVGKLISGQDEMSMIVPMLASVIGDVSALGLGMTVDEGAAMIQSTWFVAMPHGKSGISALVDVSSSRGSIPSFVPPDAVRYSRTNVKFDALLPTIRAIMRSNPIFAGPDGQDPLAEAEPTILEITSALKPELHVAASITRPITTSSMSGLFAVRCEEPQKINALLAEHAASLQLQPREFLGHTVYTIGGDAIGMMLPFPVQGFDAGLSICAAGGYVFAGTTPAVEQALRSTDKPAGGAREADATRRAVLAAIGDEEVVSWGFADVVQQWDASRQIGQLHLKSMIEQMREMDPEYAKEIEKQAQEEAGSPWARLDAAAMRRYIGPVTWSMRSVDDGFLGVIKLLRSVN